MNGEDLVGGLTPQQREVLGLTRSNVRCVAMDLKRRGELRGLSRREIAETVLDTIAAKDPTAFAAPTIDWEALIAFIERLLPLILQIISIFA